MATKRSSAQLSKNVLQMKFMQRSALRIEQEQNEENLQKIIDDEHWALDLPDYKTKESVFLKDQSYTFCEQLQYGRQSFKGCNPDIEKIMKVKLQEQQLKASAEKEKLNSVSDVDMAKRYSTLMHVIAKKFEKKRKRKTGDDVDGVDDSQAQTKKSFMKPSEDE
ncbi:M-phase phosphoprotein 6 [Biomphalaria pfeifferi]|uniref:M-phase phosphoprotein 6 n=1 Tax=Biomphalaria pfeifferi TaxID=112525 RepID=A0AAD8EVK4_BIOPF|nr:M-phase phosphoprotein 6 [Biomphalaria pfeifferi]